jgi:nitroreductase
MKPTDAIRDRRSVKRFTPRPVAREEIETMLAAAVLAPNHRLTQPWRFYVLGPDARYGYGHALGDRKAKKLENAEAAQAMRETVATEHRTLPAMIAVSVIGNENPEIAEEDYAAAMMAVQNLMLSAIELGLGTAIKSGAILNDPAAKNAMTIGDGERVIAIIHVGEPAETVAARKRDDAASFTTWLP